MAEPEHITSARAAYDATADTYAEMVGTEITAAIESPTDRAFLAAFVELVERGVDGPVADIGCGPGRVAAFLATHGINAVGVDLSPAMVAVATAAHPGIEFREAPLTDLPFPDRSLAGAVCWYSIINTPPDQLDAVWAELARVLAPGGQLLVGFQAGDGAPIHRREVYGRPVALTSYRHSPDEVARGLTAAGLHVHARAIREPDAARAHEVTPQALVLAQAAHVEDLVPM